MKSKKSKRRYQVTRNADGERQIDFQVKDPEAFAVAVLHATPGTALDKVAKKAGMAQVRTRTVIEEFQLYNMNYPAKQAWNMDELDIREHYPIVAEFGGVRGTINACCFKFRRSEIVRRNQLCRWFSAPSRYFTNLEQIGKRLDIAPKFIAKWRGELHDAVESCNMKQVNEFGESCGLEHSSEVLGSIGRSVVWTYLGTECPQVVYEIINGLGRGIVTVELITCLLRDQKEAVLDAEKENIMKRLHFHQYLFKGMLSPPSLTEEQVNWIHNHVNITNIKDLSPYRDPFLEE